MEKNEVIEKLQKHFLEQEPKIIARALANVFIDLKRIKKIYELPVKDVEYLVLRMNKNIEQLDEFIKNGEYKTFELLKDSEIS